MFDFIDASISENASIRPVLEFGGNCCPENTARRGDGAALGAIVVAAGVCNDAG